MKLIVKRKTSTMIGYRVFGRRRSPYRLSPSLRPTFLARTPSSFPSTIEQDGDRQAVANGESFAQVPFIRPSQALQPPQDPPASKAVFESNTSTLPHPIRASIVTPQRP
jgi:hypothetical protein